MTHMALSARAQARPAPARADKVLDLIDVARELAIAPDVEGVGHVVKIAARRLLGADGVTFVLREGDLVRYADEDAISPLWKGTAFPASSCVSGWAMDHRETVVIEDVYADARVPHDAYRPTFVKSMLMVPVLTGQPVAAIGAYWAERHAATPRESALLEAIAGFAAAALERAKLERELRSAVALRDELLGLAAHELRTPLTVLNLAVNGVTRALAAADVEGARRAGERLQRGTARLARLIEMLLDSTRLAQLEIPLVRERVELGGLVARVVASLPSADRARIAAEPGVVGEWDRARLEQIVANLVGNALKFGDGKPVDVSVSSHGGLARLVVADQGAGIAEEERPRLFRRFERGAAARGVGGLGLGLWIVRQNVEAHGGEIHVESRPGAGTRFTVELPLAG
ncbi:GAF sensor signal transduction histidine kinase [Anaeromyxobacter dehalogenans 2CP-C]|uniref:histidine kinase n=2 Tax=Anaeromyxobacter dehalogenans TaxID=161493 RepID=Q2IFD6_ANADE|nr:GAF sensor signal transduction histidine kinase [Anaeromyxobacter dehalogenans 2CP-C]